MKLDKKVLGIISGVGVLGLVGYGLFGATSSIAIPTLDEPAHAAFISADPVSLSSAQTYFTTTDSTSYAGFVGFNLSHSSRTTVTIDEDLTDSVSALSRALRYDPETIFAYVRDNIDVHFVYGESKGAYGAIVDFEGSPFDQARLLGLLLQEADGENGNTISVTYTTGEVELTAQQFTDWTGLTTTAQACQFLANGGFPSSLDDCSSTAALGPVTFGHVWLEVTINGVTETWDPSIKSYNDISGVDLVSLSNLTVGYGANALTSGATMGYTGTPKVRYMEGLSVGGYEVLLDNKASALMAELDGPTYYSHSVRELIGGRQIIRQFDPDKSPGDYSSWSSGLSDIPDKYRIALQVSLEWPGDPINQAPSEHIADTLLFADEVYGRLFRVRARPTCGNPNAGSNIHPDAQPSSTTAGFNGVSSFCLMLSVGDENVVESIRPRMMHYPSVTQIVSAHPRFYEMSIVYNHPYANPASDYRDAIFGTSASQYTQFGYQDGIYDREFSVFSDAVIVNGWGRTSPELKNRWGKRLGADVNSPSYGTPCGVNSEPAEDPYNTCMVMPRSSNILRNRLASSYLVQSSEFSHFTEQLSGDRLQHHRTIGIIYATHTVRDLNMNSYDYDGSEGNPDPVTHGFFASSDETLHIDVRPSYTHTPVDETYPAEAIKRTLAAGNATIEGAIFHHEAGSVYSNSTASRFTWAAQNAPDLTDGPLDAFGRATTASWDNSPSKFYLLHPGAAGVSQNYHSSSFSSLLTDRFHSTLWHRSALGSTNYPAIVSTFAGDFVDNQYFAVVPEETYLGPGNRYGAVHSIQQSGSVPGAQNRYFVWSDNPARGGALITWRKNAEQISHSIVGYDYATGGLQTKGAGLSYAEGELNLPKLPDTDTFLDAGSGPTQKYDIDYRTGVVSYNTGSMLNVGNDTAKSSLGFSMSLQNGVQTVSYADLFPWSHNWEMTGSLSSSGMELYGVSSADNSAPTILTILILLDTYSVTDGTITETGLGQTQARNILARELTGVVTLNWWMEKSINNVFTFSSGSGSTTFVRRPNGTFNPPAGSPLLVLTQTNDAVIAEVEPRTFENSDPSFIEGPYKSVYSKKWDFSDIDFSLTDQESGTEFDFSLVGMAPRGLQDPISVKYDEDNYNLSWVVDKISYLNDPDVTLEYYEDTGAQFLEGNLPLNVGNEILETLIFDGEGGIVEDNYNRAVGVDGISLSRYYELPNGARYHFSYEYGDEVQEGVIISNPGFYDGTMIPGGFLTRPYLKIKSVWEPGLDPEVDDPFVTFNYDEEDRIESVTDAEGRTTTFHVAGGRRTEVVAPDGASTVYFYDDEGRLIEMWEPAYE